MCSDGILEGVVLGKMASFHGFTLIVARSKIVHKSLVHVYWYKCFYFIILIITIIVQVRSMSGN